MIVSDHEPISNMGVLDVSSQHGAYCHRPDGLVQDTATVWNQDKPERYNQGTMGNSLQLSFLMNIIAASSL